MERLPAGTLERELGDLLGSAGLRGRQVEAVRLRLGWGGEPPATLAAAGAACGYTRERVRQLEDRARAHVAGVRPALPLTQKAVRLIEGAAPAGRVELAQLVAAKGLAAAPFDPVSILGAAGLAGRRASVFELDGVVLRRADALDAQNAVWLARMLVRRHGAASLSALTRGLAGGRLTRDQVRRILELWSEVTWLDDRQEWLLVPVESTRATTAIRKMLSVSSTLGLADVQDGLRRSARPVTVPIDVLRSLCAQLAWVEIDRRDAVRAVRPLDAARILSPLERELVGIFRASGPVLGFANAVRLAEGAGFNPTSAGLYLGRTPVLRTVSRGRYALRGDAGSLAA